MQTTQTYQPKIKFNQNTYYQSLKEQNTKPTLSKESATDTNQSFRYFRYKKLTIKHIERDQEDNERENYFEQPTCMETVFHQPPIEHPVDPVERSGSRKVARLKQNNTKIIIQDSQPGINNRWQLTSNKNLPQKCIQNLKTQKIEVYDQMVKYFELSFKKQTKKYVLYIEGDRQTGKKTLLYQAINSCLVDCQTFYLDFSAPSQKYKQQTLSLFKKLKSSCRMQASEQQVIKNILVVNNVQIFIYFLKKAQIYHQFKTFIRSAQIILVLIDRIPLDSKQFSWIAQNSQTVNVPKNSRSLFLSSLLNYFSEFKAEQVELVLAKPLANYFTVKLYEEDCLQLGIIQKFAKLVFKSSNHQQTNQSTQNTQKQTIKVTRQLIQSFRKSSLENKCTVQLQHLNLHQKIFLVTCYTYLTENNQVALPISQTQKMYRWACASLSLQPKNTKQLQRDVLHNLQTYRLIKLLLQFGKTKEKHIIITIDLCKIKEALQGDSFLSKFFTKNKNEQV